jgi:DNA polymerase-3 subunit gamma/tau
MAAPAGKPTDDALVLSGTPERGAEYVVVARRYRPQTFDELIGQDHVARALKGAIAANRVGHAYLFTGARGVGKTSSARILAKALNCEQGPTATPCNKCDICLAVNAGSDVDVIEIDGASNRGIEESRQLRQNVNIRPSRARFKIYIIDEVHMLTREAFNALLKTLEEPPEHVKFIFCTTEANKIPITILSRCQRFDFAGIHLPSIVERLSQIVAAEGVTAEPEALAILARRAAGSMRDSQSLLEQLLAIGGETITTADVHAMLGTAGDARLSKLVADLTSRNAAGAIAELDAATAEGVDVGQLLEQLLGYFRDLMVAAVGCPADTLLHTAPARHQQLAESSREIGLETILAIMQILDHTLSRLRYSTQSRTLTEMALVRIASLEQLDDLADLISQLQSGDFSSDPPAAASLRGGTSVPAATPAAKKKAEPALTPASEGRTSASEGSHTAAGDSSASAVGVPAAEANAALPPAELTGAGALRVWQAALTGLEGLLASNASLCESVASPAAGRLVATFRAKYTACRAFCERADQVAHLERALAEAAGGRIKLEFATIADAPQAAAQQRRAVPQRQRVAEVSEHPMIKRATELFDARVTRLEEPETQS